MSREKQLLYPQLDMARFFQTAGHDGNGILPETVHDPSAGGQKLSDQIEAQSFVINLPLTEHAPLPPTDPSIMEAHKLPKGPESKVVLPPLTSLAYKIRPERFNQARNSTPGSPGSYWSYNMYGKEELETGTTKNVKVHYCTSKHTMEEVCKRYFLGSDVIGFDMEWKARARAGSSPRDNVSLIQVANEGHVGLFHVAVFAKDDFVAPTFRQIMEDPKISKAGVNIKGDCTRLRTYLGVDTRGIFELSHLYKVVKYSREKSPSRVDRRVVSLATQVEEILRLPLYKGDSVRTSNWALGLDSQQIACKYRTPTCEPERHLEADVETDSASDAYAGLQLYHVLERERQCLDPTPPRPHHAELNMPLQLAISVDDEVVSDDDKLSSAEDLMDDLTGAKAKPSEKNISKSGQSAPQVSFPNQTPNHGRPSTSAASTVDQRILAAELKMQSYRAAKRAAKGGTVYARPSALRAYYIWYCNKDMTPDDIAKLLRDPPLLTHTVTGYILDAIASENLPYDKQRMAKELLSLLQPSSLASARYQPLLQECGYFKTAASPSPTVVE